MLSSGPREAGATDAGAAVESGVPFGWATGDEVYGSDRNLRRWLERGGSAPRAGHQEE